MLLENCKSFPNNPQLKVKVGKEMSTSVGMSLARCNMDKLETLAFVKIATASVTALLYNGLYAPFTRCTDDKRKMGKSGKNGTM